MVGFQVPEYIFDQKAPWEAPNPTLEGTSYDSSLPDIRKLSFQVGLSESPESSSLLL